MTYLPPQDAEPARPMASGSVEAVDMRLELARELHDGILQVLTGASLQIEALVRLGDRDPAEAFRLLRKVGDAISEEQRELRLYVDEMFGAPPPWLSLGDRLGGALMRIEDVWDVQVDLQMDPLDLDDARARLVLRVVQEAVVNSARHGRASAVTVTVRADAAHVFISIKDNGSGFSFTGSFSDEDLKEGMLGPLGLKRRIETAGGSLRIDSRATGATLDISLPLPDSPAC